MYMNIAGYVKTSLVNGPGVRLVVFTQGCPHGCEGCHNPDTHVFDGGMLIDTSQLIAVIEQRSKFLDGITLSGGEPFDQAKACKELADAAHRKGLNVWCYTGFTWKALMAEADPLRIALIESVDVLVDGPFIRKLRTDELPWRGSKNQKLIDVHKSLREHRVVKYAGDESVVHDNISALIPDYRK